MPHRGHVEIRCPLAGGCPLMEPVPRGEVPLSPVLADQQREVVAWLATGATVKQIAARMGLCLDTVKGHIKAAKAALGYRTTAQLIALAGRMRWEPCGAGGRPAIRRPRGRPAAPGPSARR